MIIIVALKFYFKISYYTLKILIFMRTSEIIYRVKKLEIYKFEHRQFTNLLILDMCMHEIYDECKVTYCLIVDRC